MPAGKRSLWLAYAGLAATALFWASNAVVARGTSAEIPPLALSFWRWCLALLIIAPLGVPQVMAHWAMVRRYWRSLAVLAALSVGLFNTLLYLAAQTTSALNIALINSAMPVLVTLLAWLLLRDPVGRWRALGIALGLAGVVLIIGRGDPANLLRLAFQPGDALMLGAITSWGLFSVLLRRQAVPLPALPFLTVQIALGLPVILPFYLWETAVRGPFVPTPELLWVFPFVAIFPGLLAYRFWNHGVSRIGPSRAAMFLYLVPVFAAILGGVFLGERLAPFHAAGGLCILLGLFLATRTRAPAGDAPEPQR